MGFETIHVDQLGIIRMIPFDLKEFEKLMTLLKENSIPYEEIITPPSEGLSREYFHCQILYPNKKYRISDVVIFRGSYGVEEGKLELMGLNDEPDGVKGYMTAQEVFDIWKADWEKRTGYNESKDNI